MLPQRTPSGTIRGAGAVGGAGLNRQDFIKSYANMVARSWVDDSYLQLVLSNTAETLANAGMPTVSGSVIRIIQVKLPIAGAKIEDQVNAWIDGNKTGLYNLFLPMKPDEFEVGPGAGGDQPTSGESCCCCPCCCCT
jgi:hypothetical protein